jgi:hypothetical protein
MTHLKSTMISKRELLLNLAVDCVQHPERQPFDFQEVVYCGRYGHLIAYYYGVELPDPFTMTESELDSLQARWEEALEEVRLESVELLEDLAIAGCGAERWS